MLCLEAPPSPSSRVLMTSVLSDKLLPLPNWLSAFFRSWRQKRQRQQLERPR